MQIKSIAHSGCLESVFPPPLKRGDYLPLCFLLPFPFVSLCHFLSNLDSGYFLLRGKKSRRSHAERRNQTQQRVFTCAWLCLCASLECQLTNTSGFSEPAAARGQWHPNTFHIEPPFDYNNRAQLNNYFLPGASNYNTNLLLCFLRRWSWSFLMWSCECQLVIKWHVFTSRQLPSEIFMVIREILLKDLLKAVFLKLLKCCWKESQTISPVALLNYKRWRRTIPFLIST